MTYKEKELKLKNIIKWLKVAKSHDFMLSVEEARFVARELDNMIKYRKKILKKLGLSY